MEKLDYEGREQSRVKHLILERYLLRFGVIVGSRWTSITYVDGFSGPWQSQSEKYTDTSFAIAIQQLRTAREQLAKREIKIQLRAYFIEKDKEAYRKLQDYAADITDVEIKTSNADFEHSIQDITNFIQAGDETFPFIFIDPTGWTGFALETIRPLLTLKHCEVLVNFMTHYVIRFINNDESSESFVKLFGSSGYAGPLEGTTREDRVDAAVFRYRDAVRAAGRFSFTGVASILNPIKQRSHFHLLYFTRHPKGIEVFKDAEERSMKDMEDLRAQAEQSHKQRKTGQKELFSADEAPESKYYLELRRRYRTLAINSVEDILRQHGRMKYDDLWKIWLQYPLAWESDLKRWIKDSSSVRVEGLEPKKRAVKRDKNHFVIWDSE